MHTPNIFSLKCERIKTLAYEALTQADMFNSFRYHRPSMSYHDAKQAAENLRACAEVVDQLAAKLAPDEVVIEAMQTAAQ